MYRLKQEDATLQKENEITKDFVGYMHTSMYSTHTSIVDSALP